MKVMFAVVGIILIGLSILMSFDVYHGRPNSIGLGILAGGWSVGGSLCLIAAGLLHRQEQDKQ
jgi:hypothetical protein